MKKCAGDFFVYLLVDHLLVERDEVLSAAL